MAGSMQKESNKNTMRLTGKISITETSCHSLEPELYTNHHNIAFKRKKDEKVGVVKAHIGSKILTSIVQESQDNIQPASDSNSASNSDGDRVERIVGSSSKSLELNDS